MAVIKYIPVHLRPKNLLKYILNREKNSDMKYASALNCEADAELAYEAFRDDFEYFSGLRFSKNHLNDDMKKGKEPIRMHHYIQSFKPGEVSPETAHKIGVEWAKKVFGDKFMVIISTHIDTDHVHNHFAVSAYDSSGKKWHANKKSLRRCKTISNDITRAYGLSVIENPKKTYDHKYGENLARKNGTSWKAKIADAIDRGIAKESVNSVDDLVAYLRHSGYKVNYGKYISVQGPENRKPVRTFRLGDGYSVESIAYRIAHKENEITAASLEKYSGIQYEYALCLMNLQIMVYRKDESLRCATYRDLVRNAELLKYICDNKITSADTFGKFADDADEKYRDAESYRKDVSEQIKAEEKVLTCGDRFLALRYKRKFTPDELSELREMQFMFDLNISDNEDIIHHREMLESLKKEYEDAAENARKAKSGRDRAGEFYRLYLSQMNGEFGEMLERMKAEKAERQERALVQEADRRRKPKPAVWNR